MKKYNKSFRWLEEKYSANQSNIRYVLKLIDCHGITILDRSYTIYTVEFKENAVRRVLIDNKIAFQISANTKKMGIMSLIIRKADHLMKSKDQQIKELQKQLKDLKQENLKLTVENEFAKN